MDFAWQTFEFPSIYHKTKDIDEIFENQRKEQQQQKAFFNFFRTKRAKNFIQCMLT